MYTHTHIYTQRLYFVFDANTLNNNIDSVNLGIYTYRRASIYYCSDIAARGNIIYIGNRLGVLCTCAVVLFKWMFFAKHQYLSVINQKRTAAAAAAQAKCTRREKNARDCGAASTLDCRTYTRHTAVHDRRGPRPTHAMTRCRDHREFIIIRYGERWTINLG